MNEDAEFKPYSGEELRKLKKFLNTERPRMYQQMVGRLLATIKLCQRCMDYCGKCKGRMEEIE